MSHSLFIGVAVGLSAILVLQGCGGGGDDTTTTKPPPTGTTTTTTSGKAKRIDPKTGLVYCEDVSTYYKTTIDSDQKKHATGACLPSATPGAYYTKPGEKNDDGSGSDRDWACWNKDMDKSQWTDKAAKEFNPPYEGACVFMEFRSTTKPSDIGDCIKQLSHHPSVCAPGPSAFWGACYSNVSENWKCISKGDDTIKGFAKGDCRAQVRLDASGDPTDYFFDGVCTFGEETQKKYKCDTVKVYSSSSSATCGGGGSEADKACFSLTEGVNWRCNDKDTPIDTPCDWTLTPEETKNFYRGYCVFKGNEDYEDALDAGDLLKLTSAQLVATRVVDVVKTDQPKTAAQTDQASTSWFNTTTILVIVALVAFCTAAGAMMTRKRVQMREPKIGTNIEMLQGQCDL